MDKLMRRARKVRSGVSNKHTTCFITFFLGCFAFIYLRAPSSALYLRQLRVGSSIDVVGVARKPTCVTKESVRRLNIFFKPKRIFIVTTQKDFCSIFEAYGRNVHCLVDQKLLPGVSHESIAAYLNAKYGVNGKHEFQGRKLAGWYLQQILKLGAAYYIQDLTQHYLVWDLDMLLLKNLDIFYPDHQKFTMKTVVNIGGARSAGYEYTYNQLTGKSLEYAPDGTSFVTHWMVMYQPYMKEFLKEIVSKRVQSVEEKKESKRGATDSMQWVWQILDSLNPDKIEIGFSEYASYASWVMQNYPDSQHILNTRTWRRHPLGGQGAVSLTRFFRRDGLCCPNFLSTKTMQILGYQYVGFEIGHAASCKFSDPKYSNGYGID